MASRQAEFETIDRNKEDAKAVAGKIGGSSMSMGKEDNVVKGARLSMISGLGPGESVMDTAKEAGGRSLSMRPEPESEAPAPDVEAGAVHAW